MLVQADTEAPLDVTRLGCAVLRTASHGASNGTRSSGDIEPISPRPEP